MTNYIIDPTRFYVQGAVVNWVAAQRRLGIQADPQKLQSTVQLRWMLSGDLGLPTEPFQVWVRAHNAQIEQPLSIQQRQLMLFFNYSLITWSNSSMSHVSVDVQAPAGGTILAFAGGPLLSNVNATLTLPTGNTTVALAAPVIDGLLVSAGVTVTAVRGSESGALSQAAGWTLRELVGLPVKKADWNGTGKHGDPQGLVGAFVDAPTAAVQRLQRGGPPIGWAPILTPSLAAPLWSAPNFGALVDEVNGTLLNVLRTIVSGFPPNQQAAQRVVTPIPPPQNSAGDTMTVTSSDAQVSPLAMTVMAASTDPFLSLVLGFGTAYAVNSDLATVALPRFDYMITAHWEKGLDGKSAPVDYAAIIPAPGAALPPVPPANLMTELLGKLRPLASDGDWRCSTRISWDRPPDSQLFQNASFAVARLGLTPPEATTALMAKRLSGGLRPIAINSAQTTPPDPLFWQLHATDQELPIPANPGNRSVKYVVAVQDIYGQWTPWASIDTAMSQPEPEPVRIVSAKLTPTPPGSGAVCPTTLEIEFLWDWRIRRPQLIRFAGYLYAASEQGTPPPSLAVPGGLTRSLGGGGGFLELTFAGDTPTAAGEPGIIRALNEGGDQAVTFGAVQGSEGRRYRLSLPGFALDFGVSGHIGLALWAQCQERIAPMRTSAWSAQPSVIATADPRPPIVPIDHVALTSLPDAAGQCHARIAWTAKPESVGYFIYESDETQILNARGSAEPTPDQTLDDRLLIIKTAFNTQPATLRRNFTRLNATAFTGTSRDVTLPRGSTAIHVYVVLGISAGQVEGNWPSGPNAKDALIAIAAPHIMNPAPPWLDVRQYFDFLAMPPAFKTKIQITTRPGPQVQKIDLHRVRVDDAAKELDTMGPPIARMQATGGGWTVTPTVDAHGVSSIQLVEGIDAPPGSWRRVWYRAVAWTAQDDTRGGLPGRSPASTAAWVVIPPADAPTISPLLLGTGPAPADVVVQWTSAAPPKRTPLGPHTLSIRAAVVGTAIGTPPLLSVDTTLDKLGTTSPATGSDAWIVSSTPSLVTYRALIRRVAIADALRFIVRITDPIGRTGEALTAIAGGPVNPPPDLTDLQAHKMFVPPPPKVLLQFNSTAPVQAPLDGPYKVLVTVVRQGPKFPPQPPITLELPLASVPKVPPAGPTTLGLYRLTGSGPVITYVAVTSLPVTQFIVQITGPDGQFVQQIQSVS